MRTQDTQTSDKKETMSALIFIAVVYLILCVAGKLSAKPKAGYPSKGTIIPTTLCDQYGSDEVISVSNKGTSKVEKGGYVIHVEYRNKKYNKVFIPEPISE
jgi:hypothetical protein